jgi:hypothetical protein
MPVTISSAALARMTEAERARFVESAFDSSPDALANYLAVVDARLAVFEQRYEAPTAALPDMLARGELHETADVSAWLFWAGLRSDLARKARP